MYMNSVLTTEERVLLQSIGCRDREQALDVLEDIEMSLPLQSDLFYNAVALSNKLKGGEVDFWSEMREIVPEDEEEDTI